MRHWRKARGMFGQFNCHDSWTAEAKIITLHVEGWDVMSVRLVAIAFFFSHALEAAEPVRLIMPRVERGQDLGDILSAAKVTPFKSGHKFSFKPNRSPIFVVAGLGDSYGAGEGAPVSKANWVNGAAKSNPPSNLEHMWGDEYGLAQCHRSDNAAIVLAFKKLQKDFPSTPMKLIFLACAGAEIRHVINDVKGDHAGERTDRWLSLHEKPQLQQLEKKLQGIGADAQVDVLEISIGGNDMGFGPVVTTCMQHGAPRFLLDGGVPRVVLEALLGSGCNADLELRKALRIGNEDIAGWNELAKGYGRIAKAIKSFPRRIRNVLIVPYAVGLQNEHGEYCGGADSTTKADLLGLVDRFESSFLDRRLVQGLHSAIQDAVEKANSIGGPRWDMAVIPSEFSRHGICSGEPWTNSMNAALNFEGDNYPEVFDASTPEPIDDPTRVAMDGLKTTLFVSSGILGPCVFGPACVFTAGLGAQLGLIFSVADGPVQLSTGVAHPNKRGYEVISRSLNEKLRDALLESFTPAEPEYLQQVSAQKEAAIVVRWDDAAENETFYEAKVLGFDDQKNVLMNERLPSDATRFEYPSHGPFVGTIQVRACNETACSSESTQVKVTNIEASVPQVAAVVLPSHHKKVPSLLQIAGSDPNKADTSTRIELREFRALPTKLGAAPNNVIVLAGVTPFPAIIPLRKNNIHAGKYIVRAASCNVLGCSALSDEVTVEVTADPKEWPKMSLPKGGAQ